MICKPVEKVRAVERPPTPKKDEADELRQSKLRPAPTVLKIAIILKDVLILFFLVIVLIPICKLRKQKHVGIFFFTNLAYAVFFSKLMIRQSYNCLRLSGTLRKTGDA